MFKINKKVEYALIILKFMDSKTDSTFISTREISDLYGIPFDTASKVMQAMNHKNIVHSIQGVNGGYTLAIDLKKLSFLELYKIITNQNFEQICIKANKPCELTEICTIKTPMNLINSTINKFLSHLSIKQIINEQISDDFFQAKANVYENSRPSK